MLQVSLHYHYLVMENGECYGAAACNSLLHQVESVLLIL